MLATLQATKQRSGKDLMEYIKRFRDIALDYYDHCEEKTLVEMCMGNMIMEYRVVLENLEISQFTQLLQKVRKTTQSVRLALTGPKNRGPLHKPWQYLLAKGKEIGWEGVRDPSAIAM